MCIRDRYDLDGKLLVEQPGNSTAHRDHVYLDALPLALIDVPVNPATQATKAYAIHTDHLDPPMRLTDTTGTAVWALDSTPFDAIHGAFGLPNEDVDLNGISITYNARFPGQYFDAETGLNYNYFRDYDPSIGRYIESDPIGLEGGLNTYGYALQNPVKLTDPRGLATAMCTAPLHALTDKLGSEASEWAREYVPYAHHQFLCVNHAGGPYTCGGQDQRGEKWYDPVHGPGKKSNDEYNENTCDQVEPDNTCIEECVIRKAAEDRPSYGIPFGTDCQEWADDTLEECRQECKK